MRGLRQDHQGLRQLIALLQRKLEVLNQGKMPNCNLMIDVIDYIENYAGHYHHPKEDIIYNYIIKLELDNKWQFLEIIQQHKQFKEITNRLQIAIQNILLDTIVPQETFIRQLTDFIEAEQNHLDSEDKIIFPLIESLLTDEDWSVISRSIPAQVEEPLFGMQIHGEYQDLYQRLTETETG